MYTSVSFDKLSSHTTTAIIKIQNNSIIFQKNPSCFLSLVKLFLIFKPWQPLVCSSFYGFPFSRMSYKCNHTACSLLGLASFIQQDTFELQPWHCEYYLFVLLNIVMCLFCGGSLLFTIEPFISLILTHDRGVLSCMCNSG